MQCLPRSDMSFLLVSTHSLTDTHTHTLSLSLFPSSFLSWKHANTHDSLTHPLPFFAAVGAGCNSGTAWRTVCVCVWVGGWVGVSVDNARFFVWVFLGLRVSSCVFLSLSVVSLPSLVVSLTHSRSVSLSLCALPKPEPPRTPVPRFSPPSPSLPLFLPRESTQPRKRRRTRTRKMSSENLPPRVAKLIMREIRQLAKNPPDGVKFVPGDEDCLNEIYADINGPGTCTRLRCSQRPCLGDDWRRDSATSSNSTHRDWVLLHHRHAFIIRHKSICTFREVANHVTHVELHALCQREGI